ncbi:ComF family protein [Candidatus Dojkabacteria bacterium]|nr:ComF family protein [Candidatus Dojkabacteria bacterium]
MKTFKYQYYYAIIAELIPLAKDKISRYIKDKDVLVPVPLTSHKSRNRGFNQTELIARQIVQITGSKIVQALKRVRESDQSAGKTKEQREKDCKNPFILDQQLSSEIMNKNIIIVDDVCTTGITMNNCAQVLSKAQPRDIYAFAMFRGSRITKKIHKTPL